MGDESKSDGVKDVFSLIPKPPFALDTIIASAIGECRFQLCQRMYQLIQGTSEIAFPFSEVTLIP